MYERTALGEQIVPRRDAEAETGRRTAVARLLYKPTEQQPCRRESGVEPWSPTQRFAKRSGDKSAVVQQHEQRRGIHHFFRRHAEQARNHSERVPAHGRRRVRTSNRRV